MKVERTCLQCGIKFFTEACNVKMGRGKYHSRECAHQAMSKKVKRVCKKCGTVFETYLSEVTRGGGKYCGDKCAHNVKNTRKLYANSAEKSRARSKKKDIKEYVRRVLRSAVTAGKIIKPTLCSKCGKEGCIHGHHEDYSKPFEVIWVCQKCHTAIHQELKLQKDSETTTAGDPLQIQGTTF